MAILEHFGEDAYGRDGHGHASKIKTITVLLLVKNFNHAT
jgi:hypothetical protein